MIRCKDCKPLFSPLIKPSSFADMKDVTLSINDVDAFSSPDLPASKYEFVS